MKNQNFRVAKKKNFDRQRHAIARKHFEGASGVLWMNNTHQMNKLLNMWAASSLYKNNRCAADDKVFSLEKKREKKINCLGLESYFFF